MPVDMSAVFSIRMTRMPGLAVVTISDRCAAGQQVDTTGPAVARLLAEQWPEETIGRGLVPDSGEAIATLLHELCHQEYELVLTTGGTGLGPRDVTPEATRRVIDREAPGLAEAMRAGCAPAYQFAWLGRGVAGLCGKTLIVNLPGSERGAVESLRAILPLLPHALEVVAGGATHPEA
jgi:molybdopterin adenylyltransferase